MLSIESSYTRYETETLISEKQHPVTNATQVLGARTLAGYQQLEHDLSPQPAIESCKPFQKGSKLGYIRKNNYLLARMYQQLARHRSHALSIVIYK